MSCSYTKTSYNKTLCYRYPRTSKHKTSKNQKRDDIKLKYVIHNKLQWKITYRLHNIIDKSLSYKTQNDFFSLYKMIFFFTGGSCPSRCVGGRSLRSFSLCRTGNEWLESDSACSVTMGLCCTRLLRRAPESPFRGSCHAPTRFPASMLRCTPFPNYLWNWW